MMTPIKGAAENVAALCRFMGTELQKVEHIVTIISVLSKSITSQMIVVTVLLGTVLFLIVFISFVPVIMSHYKKFQKRFEFFQPRLDSTKSVLHK